MRRLPFVRSGADRTLHREHHVVRDRDVVTRDITVANQNGRSRDERA
jgi:hypothetical protein